MPKTVIESVEELKSLAGNEAGVSDWFTVTQNHIDEFAAVTEDRQWIHVDKERAAAESPYKSTIAHGFFTLSMLSHLSRETIELRGNFKMRINYGLNRVRFPAAVPAGSNIRGRFTVASVEDIDGGVQVVWQVTIEIEGGTKPACAAEWVIRAYC